jgi:sugar phosphate isomerase/epimerase
MSASAEPGEETSTRRTWLGNTTGVLAGVAAQAFVPPSAVFGQQQSALPEHQLSGAPTTFQLACMTLPYSEYPFERALQGIKQAGFEYVAWGTTHRKDSSSPSEPVIAADAPASRARELGQECRDLGLDPLMMFSMVYPEADDAMKVMTSRIRQAEAAGIRQVLTFGHNEGSAKQVWIQRFKQLGAIANDHNVMIVIKQHGGSTGTGQACAEIVQEVSNPNVMVCYDAGNVMDYLNVDPIPDIVHCSNSVRSFCIKDHRNWPKDEDCGAGFGSIDHYQLLHPVAFAGIDMPLCCENISAPLVPRPSTPEEIDSLALRSRLYLATVVSGLRHWGTK